MYYCKQNSTLAIGKFLPYLTWTFFERHISLKKSLEQTKKISMWMNEFCVILSFFLFNLVFSLVKIVNINGKPVIP